MRNLGGPCLANGSSSNHVFSMTSSKTSSVHFSTRVVIIFFFFLVSLLEFILPPNLYYMLSIYRSIKEDVSEFI